MALLKLEIKNKQAERFFLFCLFFIFLACNSIKENNVKNRIINTDFDYNNLIRINVKINDSVEGQLIFDTGSNHTIIDKKLSKSLKTKNSEISGFYNTLNKIEYGVIKNIIIGNNVIYESKDVRYYNFPDNFLAPGDIGILGMDIIKNNVWLFDFINKRLTIKSNSDNYFFEEYKNFFRVNFLNGKSKIKSDIYINGNKISNVKFDTGCNCDFSLIDNNQISTIDFKIENNLTKTITNDDFILPIKFKHNNTATINSLESDSVMVNLSKRNAFNILGLDLFTKDTLIIDAIKNKVLFKNLKFNSIQQNLKGYRLGFSNNDIVVQAIIKDSLVDKLGLRVGDKIIKVNSLKPTISIKSIDSLNKIRNKIRTIEILRNKDTLNFLVP